MSGYSVTVEWRCFNSTLHAGKVAAYVNLCLAISAQAIAQRIASPLCSSVLFFLPVDFITLLIPSPGPVTLQVGQQMVTGVLEFIPIESQAHQPNSEGEQLENIWYEGFEEHGSNRRDHYNGSRYYALNLHSTFYRGTVEWRCFNSTLHAGKVAAYVNLCLDGCCHVLQNLHTRYFPIASGRLFRLRIMSGPAEA